MSREKLYILAEKTWKAGSKKFTFYIVKFYMALDNFWHVEIANMYNSQRIFLAPLIKLNYQHSSLAPLYPYKCEIDSKRGHQHDVKDI